MMEERYYLGVDVGTSSTKGVLIDSDHRIICTKLVMHDMENPAEGYYEHDAETVWWKEVCTVCRQLISESGVDPKEIGAVGMSTIGSDCLPVDEECRPLRKAILYGIDSRAQEEIDWLTRHYGPEKVQRLFERPICTGDVSAKILWVKNHEPEIYAKTYKFLTGSSYLTAKLTGNYVLDQFLAQASFRPLYAKDGSVNEEECTLFCRPDQICDTLPVHAVAGTVTRQAALDTGLAEGTKVIVGTGDSSAEAISTGVIGPGDMMLQFGSTLFLYYCSSVPVTDNRMRGNNYLVPGTYSLAGGTNTCGALTQWFRDTMFQDAAEKEKTTGINAFSSMANEIVTIPAGSDGLIVLPYFSGERTPINDPKAKGVVFGLSKKHTRAHIYKAALEGIGYSLRQHLDVIHEHGLPIRKIMAVGGGTNNDGWMQCIADIIQQPINVAEETVGAAYGDALMAAIADGNIRDFNELGEGIRIKKTYIPDSANGPIYSKMYNLYCKLYQNTKEIMHEISN